MSKKMSGMPLFLFLVFITICIIGLIAQQIYSESKYKDDKEKMRQIVYDYKALMLEAYTPLQEDIIRLIEVNEEDENKKQPIIQNAIENRFSFNKKELNRLGTPEFAQKRSEIIMPTGLITFTEGGVIQIEYEKWKINKNKATLEARLAIYQVEKTIVGKELIDIHRIDGTATLKYTFVNLNNQWFINEEELLIYNP